jgi:hypothetical protein
LKVNISKNLKGFKKIVDRVLDSSTQELSAISNDLQNALMSLKGATLSIGFASEDEFGSPVVDSNVPVYCGDAAWVGNEVIDAQTKVLASKNIDMLDIIQKRNMQTGKYDVHFGKKCVQDALGALGNGQLFAPWNVSYFNKLFKQPLSYWHAKDLVKIYAGTDPWAEVMSLATLGYAGGVNLATQGTEGNTFNQDVSVRAGLSTASIINMTVSYQITMEEQHAAMNNSNPFAGQAIAEKQKYADYVLELFMAYLIYYGNSATGTLGLFNINNITTFSGSSLKTIAAGASTTKGSDMAANIIGIINDFLTASDNKFNEVRIAVDPYSYNLLNSTFYSANYNPVSPMKIIYDNYEAGRTKDGSSPNLVFFSDPLLKASTVFNSTTSDYLVISAPEISGGTDNEGQDLLQYGAPLDKFVYPAIPTPYGTQYKQLKRVSGVYAPYTPCVHVYSGVGVKSGS